MVGCTTASMALELYCDSCGRRVAANVLIDRRRGEKLRNSKGRRRTECVHLVTRYSRAHRLHAWIHLYVFMSIWCLQDSFSDGKDIWDYIFRPGRKRDTSPS